MFVLWQEFKCPCAVCGVKLAVTQHLHCEYWLNTFAHILGVEFGLVYCGVELAIAEMACVSRNVRPTRSESLPAFRSNVPFLNAIVHILCS